MKRILSMILVVTLLSAAVVMTASAQESDWANKLSFYLKETLDKTDPDASIGVAIELTDIDAEEADRQLVAATGYTRKELKRFAAFRQSSIEMHDVIAKGDEVLAGLYTQYNDEMMQKLGVESVRFSSLKKAYVIADIPSANIPAIAQSDAVLRLYLSNPVKAAEGKTLHYADRFMGYLGEEYAYIAEQPVWSYDEVYEHQDADGETDWAMLHVVIYAESAPWIFGTVIGNRVFVKDGWDTPFNTGYDLYDVKNDKFIDVNNQHMNSCNFDPADYPGFLKAFDEYASRTAGYQVNRLLGDLDNNGEISVVDATIIQRCEAKMRDYPADDGPISLDSDSKTNPSYYCDFDRDGERDITDATAIQRYLVTFR